MLITYSANLSCLLYYCIDSLDKCAYVSKPVRERRGKATTHRKFCKVRVTCTPTKGIFLKLLKLDDQTSQKLAGRSISLHILEREKHNNKIYIWNCTTKNGTVTDFFYRGVSVKPLSLKSYTQKKDMRHSINQVCDSFTMDSGQVWQGTVRGCVNEVV